MAAERSPREERIRPAFAPRAQPRSRGKHRFPRPDEDKHELVVVDHLHRELLLFVEEKLGSGEDLDIADAIANADAVANADQAEDAHHMRLRLDADQLEILSAWLVARSAYFERAHIEVANRAVEARVLSYPMPELPPRV